MRTLVSLVASILTLSSVACSAGANDPSGDPPVAVDDPTQRDPSQTASAGEPDELHTQQANNGGFGSNQICVKQGDGTAPCATCYNSPVSQVCCWNTGDGSCFVTQLGHQGGKASGNYY